MFLTVHETVSKLLCLHHTVFENSTEDEKKDKYWYLQGPMIKNIYTPFD